MRCLENLISTVCKANKMAAVPEENRPEACPGPSSGDAGKASACAGCPNQKICSTGAAQAPDPDMDAILKNMEKVKNKIIVLSGKGGVGKSTVAAMVARALALDPKTEVGLLDVDVCGPSQPRVMGALGETVHSAATGLSPIYVEDNLAVMSIGFLLEDADSAVMWRGPNKNGLIKRFLRDVDWGEMEYLVIDTPPGTSDEHLTLVHYLSQTSGSTSALVVTTPQEVAIMDVRRQLTFCQKVKLPVIGIVENMSVFVCPKCQVSSPLFPSSTGGADSLTADCGVAVVAKIPLDSQVAKNCDSGHNFLLQNAESAAGKAYSKLAQNIQDYFSNKSVGGR